MCLKCLEKQRWRRYATALELEEELRRFREGEPVRARPVQVWVRAVKWARRRPTLAALYGLLLVVLILGGVGGVMAWLWQDAVSARGQAEKAGKDAEFRTRRSGSGEAGHGEGAGQRNSRSGRLKRWLLGPNSTNLRMYIASIWAQGNSRTADSPQGEQLLEQCFRTLPKQLAMEVSL